MAKQYWLMKSEAECFSIDDLFAAKNQTTHWDGIRNYEVRNMLRDQVKVGDLVLFYHSNGKPPGVAGIAEVMRAGYPDFTAFEKGHEHFDPKSKADNPTWYMVDLKAVEKFKHYVGLPELREISELSEMGLFRKNRLSVTPVTRMEFDVIKKLGKAGK
jgi:predicted RNA-binding protein with PUA-like domain